MDCHGTEREATFKESVNHIVHEASVPLALLGVLDSFIIICPSQCLAVTFLRGPL